MSYFCETNGISRYFRIVHLFNRLEIFLSFEKNLTAYEYFKEYFSRNCWDYRWWLSKYENYIVDLVLAYIPMACIGGRLVIKNTL